MNIISKDIRRHDFISGEPSKYTIINGYSVGGVIGFKGEQFLEPGYVFAPYIPMMDLETEFAPRLSVASRYATREVNPNFYGRITVNELYNGVQLPTVGKRFV